MLIVNLYGAPSAGKSTMVSYLFHELKKLGENCELVTEFAKDLCWQEDKVGLRNQMYVAGNQILRIDRLRGKTDIVVTDAPLLLQTIYYRLNKCPEPDLFEKIIYAEYNKDKNLNIFLKAKETKSEGRIWLNKVDEIEESIIKIFNTYDINYYNAERENPEEILGVILDKVIKYEKI